MSDINKLLEDVNDACIRVWDGVEFVNNKTNSKASASDLTALANDVEIHTNAIASNSTQLTGKEDTVNKIASDLSIVDEIRYPSTKWVNDFVQQHAPEVPTATTLKETWEFASYLPPTNFSNYFSSNPANVNDVFCQVIQGSSDFSIYVFDGTNWNINLLYLTPSVGDQHLISKILRIVGTDNAVNIGNGRATWSETTANSNNYFFYIEREEVLMPDGYSTILNGDNKISVGDNFMNDKLSDKADKSDLTALSSKVDTNTNILNDKADLRYVDNLIGDLEIILQGV